jgi:hypothetical protein
MATSDPICSMQWTWPVVERLVFDSQVLSTHNRTEQRIAMRRGLPRISYTTTVVAKTKALSRRLDAILFHDLKGSIDFGIWPQASPIACALSLGSMTIPIDTRWSQYASGDDLLLWSQDRCEQIEIAVVADTQITLAAATEQEFAAGDWIMPVATGRIVSAVEVEAGHNWRMAQITIEQSSGVTVDDYVAEIEYDELIVQTQSFYWPGSSRQLQHTPDVAILQSNSGPYEIVSNSELSEVSETRIWIATTRPECWSARQFAYTIRGRQKPFIAPTRCKDLILSRAAAIADDSLYVQSAGWYRVDAAGHRSHIAIVTDAESGDSAYLLDEDGELLLDEDGVPLGRDYESHSLTVRAVVAVDAVSDEEERIELDDAIDHAFAVGTSICWADRCRLGDDTVTMEWTGRNKMRFPHEIVRL